MLTVNDVHYKIEDISSKYAHGNPTIHIHSLISELHASKEEIMPHLMELHTRGVITYFDPLKDTFLLIGKSMEEN